MPVTLQLRGRGRALEAETSHIDGGGGGGADSFPLEVAVLDAVGQTGEGVAQPREGVEVALLAPEESGV